MPVNSETNVAFNEHMCTIYIDNLCLAFINFIHTGCLEPNCGSVLSANTQLESYIELIEEHSNLCAWQWNYLLFTSIH